jgi:enoyl-[acyl-carrier protein] reductase III
MQREGDEVTILITGGSKGIGRAIAERFAADGAHVLINFAHDDAAAERAVAAVEEAGGTATLLKADLSTPSGLQQLIDAATAHVDRIDQVVHGAVLPTSAPVLDLDVERFSQAVWLNGSVLLHLVQGVRPLLTHGSSVFFISSRGSKVVVPNYASIGAPKAMAECLVRYLAVELAADGIRVLTVSSAGVLTDAVRSVLPNAEERFAQMAEKNPSGRNLEVDDIAELVRSLSDQKLEMLTGREIFIDGGMFLAT